MCVEVCSFVVDMAGAHTGLAYSSTECKYYLYTNETVSFCLLNSLPEMALTVLSLFWHLLVKSVMRCMKVVQIVVCDPCDFTVVGVWDRGVVKCDCGSVTVFMCVAGKQREGELG